jgi:hypothetical protein
MQWGYSIVQSNGGQVQVPTGTISVAQMLNYAGSKGGELVAVVPAGEGVFEWVLKFPAQAPAQLF